MGEPGATSAAMTRRIPGPTPAATSASRRFAIEAATVADAAGVRVVASGAGSAEPAPRVRTRIEACSGWGFDAVEAGVVEVEPAVEPAGVAAEAAGETAVDTEAAMVGPPWAAWPIAFIGTVGVGVGLGAAVGVGASVASGVGAEVESGEPVTTSGPRTAARSDGSVGSVVPGSVVAGAIPAASSVPTAVEASGAPGR